MSRAASFPFRSEAAREEYLAFYDHRAERWPVPSETRLVATSFGQTFVRASGPTNAPALVLLPGMSSSGLMWESLIEPLSRDFRAYAIESVSDVGRSVATRDVRSAEDYTQWLDEVFAALDLREVNLVGMSYGAWITANMALHRRAIAAPLRVCDRRER
ncbi:MAG: alpha/beta fold hydrolase [Myxococcales bacterium]|nr:alpha/beta fold hydrolase [Myxococcales bacterium]